MWIFLSHGEFDRRRILKSREGMAYERMRLGLCKVSPLCGLPLRIGPNRGGPIHTDPWPQNTMEVP